jgi:hypothetical protein
MDGRLWMIQGKREKKITPADITKILSDINDESPPYGYILAASTTFSKASYDRFRQLLKQKGVMEFYIWGTSELEDMLYLPKNDRIMFTFFGVSLVSRRRSRSTEIRNTVTVKNILYKILGEPQREFNSTILLRDINDIHYPFASEYVDFQERPRWIEREAFHHHPLGIIVRNRRCFAYVDRDRKEWDFFDRVKLLYKRVETESERDDHHTAVVEILKVYDFLASCEAGRFSYR